MALLFCPLAEIKIDASRSRYVAFITGLGFDSETDQPVLGGNDMAFSLDVAITPEDIETINQIRFCFDSLMKTILVQDAGDQGSAAEKDELTNKIKYLVLR